MKTQKSYKMSEKERMAKREEMRRYREKHNTRKSEPTSTYAATIARYYVQNYLSSHPCVDCGNPDTRVLEFDHVRGKKSFEISRGIQAGRKLPEIMSEIEKCDVRCANCHRIRHREQQ